MNFEQPYPQLKLKKCRVTFFSLSFLLIFSAYVFVIFLAQIFARKRSPPHSFLILFISEHFERSNSLDTVVIQRYESKIWNKVTICLRPP